MVEKPFLDGLLVFFIDRAENLQLPDQLQKGTSSQQNIFVSGRIGPTILFKTKAIKNSANPVWEKKYKNSLCQESEFITINIRNLTNDLGGSSEVASINYSCEDIVKGNKIDGWFDLKHNGTQNGRIKMSLEYYSTDELENIKQNQVMQDVRLLIINYLYTDNTICRNQDGLFLQSY